MIGQRYAGRASDPRTPSAGSVAISAAAGSRRTLQANEVLYVQGERLPDPPLYAVVQGLLLVERESVRGHRHLLPVLGPGDLAGEVGALDPRPRSARITAHGPATVAVVPREQFLAWLAERPDSCAAVLRGLSRRVQLTEALLADVTGLSAAGRVVQLLVELTDRLGVAGPAGVAVEHGLTQQQLACLAGSTRESVNKTLRLLVGRGWLVQGRGRLLVKDLDGLRRAALPPVGASSGATWSRRPRALARPARRE